MASKQELEQCWELLQLLQPGDIVGVEGQLCATRTGEISIRASSVNILCKSLANPPEKFHGIKDVETLHRKRYLDMIYRPESLKHLQQRSWMISRIRQLLNMAGFLEVETPILQPFAGGAAARPFETHHNALDMDLYLRIAPELYLKRLLVGGMEKVFEIGKNFRNEGVDGTHNPEFTMLELYEAYGDYDSMEDITRRIFATVGLDKLSQAKTMTYSDVFKEFCNIRLVDAFADPFAEWRKPTGTN